MRAEFGIPESACVVSLVGRVCEEKRQDLLIDAALLGSEEIYYLIIGGDPPPEEGQRKLQRLISRDESTRQASPAGVFSPECATMSAR